MIEFNLLKRTDLEPEVLERFKMQRIERGFADCDWWDLNDYLLWLLPGILEVFLKESHGCTGDADETAFDLFSASEEENQKRREKWEETLKEMIEHFRRAEQYRGSFIGGMMMKSLIDQALEKEELHELLEHLPPETLAAYESGDPNVLSLVENWKDNYSDEEMKKGFDLLKKHFWRLWD